MIRRKLIILNIVIFSLTVGLTAFISINVLRNHLYRENVLVYEDSISKAYSAINNVLAQAKDSVLTICASRNLNNMLSQQMPSHDLLQDSVNELRDALNVNSVEIYPVRDNDVFIWDEDQQMYIGSSDSIYDYPLDYGYSWSFRPDGHDSLRVTRAMYDLDDISRVVAIVNLDVVLTDVNEAIYGFSSNDDSGGKLYLLDGNDNFLLPYHRQGKMDLSNAINGSIPQEEPWSARGEITLYTVFPQNGWKLVTVLSETNLYKDSRAQISTMFFISVALELIGIIAVFLITSRFTEPVKKLSDEMHLSRNREQFRHIDVPDGTEGELKELYDSYNYLVDEVNRSILEAEEFSKKDAEYQFKLLQAEINPHFLYNTLNMVSWMAAGHQDEDIQKVIIALVGLYRISLNNGKATLPLRKEIEHVRNYLEIMSYRYPESYEVEFDVEAATEDFYVTKQMLQPLAENALVHGFLESERKGVIRISSHLVDGYLILDVSNTGGKVDLEKVRKLLNGDPELSQKHYGIRNVNDRLKMYYGEDCQLNYFIDEEGATVARIKLPVDRLKVE